MKHFAEISGLPVGEGLPHWQPCERPSREAMIGHYCRLEGVDVDRHGRDLYEAFQLNTDQSSWAYLPYGPFDSFDSFEYWLDSCKHGDDPLFYAVIDKDTGIAVGLVSYLRMTPNVGVIEVGHIHFSPLLQRTPMATEAMYLMMKRVFDELGYRRYEWKCDALNEPSAKAAARLGFTFEGIFRQATIYKGRNRDTAWFSITDKEWPVLRNALERWLAVENFDSCGQQIQPLAMLR